MSLRSLAPVSLLAAALTSCAASARSTRAEGLDPATLPPEVQPDYQVFSERCSKCHGLARALDSGVADETFWERYVRRMRRQPGSGIEPRDEAPILRFLRFHAHGVAASPPTSSPPNPASTSR